MLNPDIIDGIMLEEKVILSSQELSQYFGKDKTLRQMKDIIIKLLENYKARQKEVLKPEKKMESKEK